MPIVGSFSSLFGDPKKDDLGGSILSIYCADSYTHTYMFEAYPYRPVWSCATHAASVLLSAMARAARDGQVYRRVAICRHSHPEGRVPILACGLVTSLLEHLD